MVEQRTPWLTMLVTAPRARFAPIAVGLLVAGLCLSVLGLGGCNRPVSQSTRSINDLDLSEPRGARSPLADPFQGPTLEGQGLPGLDQPNISLVPPSASPGLNQSTTDPVNAAPPTGLVESSTFAGPQIDPELASIPVPAGFDVSDPSPARDVLQKGVQLMNQGKWDEAIKAFYEALKLEPDSAHAYESLGQCYYNKDEPSKAIANLDSAIRLDPKYIAAYICRATANIKLRYIQRALGDLDTVLKLEPKNLTALIWRSIAYINDGHAREARADCTAALELNAGSLDAYVVRCLANLQLGDPNGARADYQTAVKAHLNEESLKMMRGWFESFGQNPNPPAAP